MKGETVLGLTGISKFYAGNPALSGMNMDLASGEVHALLGENGAGKSTLVKIVSGGIKADEGEMLFQNEQYSASSPAEAQHLGVVAVQQELSLSPYLPVYQNIWLGNRHKAAGRFISSKKLKRMTSSLQEYFGTSINPDKWVCDLSLEEQQIVEILKALAYDPKVIILDEPTSALGAENTRWLLKIIDSLKQRGSAILFISHRLPEILQIADRVTVLKDGDKVATSGLSGITEDDLVRMMVGRDLEDIFPVKKGSPEKTGTVPLMKVENLVTQSVFGVTFNLQKGEILGLAGLEGQGQHDLLLSLFGLQSHLSGSVAINNKYVTLSNPSLAISSGISLVPIDRRTEGVILPLSVAQNIAMSTLGKRQKLGWIDHDAEQKIVEEMINRLAIKTRNETTPVGHLSGGNQQKVALGKCLAVDPAVLLLDDPTRGVDIQARRDIYHHIQFLADDGAGVILSSTDTIELIGICDRVLVIYAGKIAAELVGEEITEERIVSAAVGMNGA